jgi:DDE family transposase
MYMQHAPLQNQPSLSPSQIADLRLAASTLTGPNRRAFEAEMTVQYWGGTPLMAAALFGWGRQTVALGLAERRTGLMGLGAPSACSGCHRWEERHPPAAQALRQLAEAPAQHDPTFRTRLTSTRLTAQAALQVLNEQGEREEQVPSPRTLAAVLNRLGFRLRKVVKATPQKKSKETAAIFDKRKKRGTSRGIGRRQTRESRWESTREDRRVCP